MKKHVIQMLVFLLIFSGLSNYIPVKVVKAEEELEESFIIYLKEDLPIVDRDKKKLGRLYQRMEFIAKKKKDQLQIDWFGEKVLIDPNLVELVAEHEDIVGNEDANSNNETIHVKKGTIVYHPETKEAAALVEVEKDIQIVEEQETYFIAILSGKRVVINKEVETPSDASTLEEKQESAPKEDSLHNKDNVNDKDIVHNNDATPTNVKEDPPKKDVTQVNEEQQPVKTELFSSDDQYFKVKADLVPVYVKEDSKLIEVGSLSKDAVYKRKRDYTSWHQITFGDQVAYVHKDQTVPTDGKSLTENKLKNLNQYISITKDTNVYDNSGQTLDPFVNIKAGTRISILKQYTSWYAVEIAGRLGFIRSEDATIEVRQAFLKSDRFFKTTSDHMPVYVKKNGKLVQTGTLMNGQVYERTNDYTSWHQITIGDQIAYVHKDFTVPNNGTNVKNLNKNLKNIKQYITTKSTAEVYDNSSRDLIAFATLEPGTKLSILKQYTSWYAVEVAGRIGYIRISDVKSQFSASAKYFSVTADTLPIYDNSSGELVIVGYVLKGETYPRTKGYTSWHRISFGSINGFVAKDGTIPSTGGSLKNISKDSRYLSKKITFTEDAVVYDNTSGRLIPFAEIKTGQTFSVKGEYTSWWEIDVAGRIGFVRKGSSKSKVDEKQEENIKVVPSSSTRYNPFVITTTKTTDLYIKSGNRLVRKSGVAKNRAFVPESISSSYYVIKPSSTRYYIPINDAKLTIPKPIYLTNFKSGDFDRLVSYYYTKSKIGEIPYIYNEYTSSELKEFADNAIKGKWELLANPYHLTVNNVNEFDWRTNLPYVNSFLFQLNYLMVVEQLTQAYKEYGNPAYLTYAKSVIESWYRNFPVENYRSYKWGYNDHGTALRSFILIDFWNVYKKTALNTDAEFSNSLMTLFYEHAWLLSQESFYRPRNNHGMFQDLALLAISETYPEMEASNEWNKIATTRLMEQINFGISKEGLHMEHSPSYQLYIYNSLIDFVDWAKANGFDLPKEMIKRVEAMPNTLTYLTKPDRTLPLFGDSPASKMSTNLIPYPEKYPELTYSFTDGKQGVEPVKRAINLSNQFAILRQHWGGEKPFDQSVYFGMTAGYHSTAHKHPDDLSFELYGFGGDYIVETGRYAYLATPQRSTAMSTKAHNVVQVEGTEFSLDKANLEKSQIDQVGIRSDGIMEAVGSHSLTPGVKHKRSVHYDQEQTFIVVDYLQSSSAKNYIQRFHLAPDFNVTKQDVRETVATHPSGRTLTAIQLYAPNDITEDVGTSHVAYQDYTWVSRPELMYKQRGSNVRYMTILHLGKTKNDTIIDYDLIRDGNDYVVKYKTSTNSEVKTIRFTAKW